MPTTEMPTVVASETVFGLGKRINKELEELPLHTHAALINLLNTMMQHRQIGEQVIREQKQQAIQEKQISMMEAEQKRQADAAALKASGLVLASR